MADTFAVVETTPKERRILMLIEDAKEAEAIALELRGRGLSVSAGLYQVSVAQRSE